MKRNIIFIVIVLSTLSFAQSTSKSGTTAAQFLKIGIGPRAIGMGSAFTATANDLTAMYWNPAGIASNYSTDAMFNHINWIADTGLDFAGASSNIPDIGTIGAFVTMMKAIDGMMVRTVETPEGTGERFDAGSLAIGVSFARELTDNFSIGFNAKYIRDYIWHESAAGFALDAGVLYKIDILNEFRLGASISNFGTKMKLDGRDIIEVKQVGESGQGNLINSIIQMEEWDLPLLFRIGVAADIIKLESIKLTTAIDAVHPNDHSEYLNLGTEFNWLDLLFFRVGINSLFEEKTEKGLTAGVGLNYRILQSLAVRFDYAYQDVGRLKNAHYFSVGVKF